MFECPTCEGQFSLPDYLEHAKQCGGNNANANGPNNNNNNANDTGNLSNDSSVGSREEAPMPQQDESPLVNEFTCPLCMEKFPMAVFALHAPTCKLGARNQEKRSSMGNAQNEENRKRSRLNEEIVHANKRVDERVEQHQQQPNNNAYVVNVNREVPAAPIQPPAMQIPVQMQMPSTTIPMMWVNNAGDTSQANAYRQGTQMRIETPIRAQEQPLASSSRVSSAPRHPAESPMGNGISMNPNQSQYANYVPQVFVAGPGMIQQTPVQANPTMHPRRFKEELIDNGPAIGAAGQGVIGRGAAIAGHGGANAGAANGPVINGWQDLYDIINPRLRQLETDVGDVRRRVEMFEASMMMKLGAIETAINRLKE